MSVCASCTPEKDSKFICVACHDAKLQEALDMILNLQRELRTITTKYSFAKFALDLKLADQTKKDSKSV